VHRHQADDGRVVERLPDEGLGYVETDADAQGDDRQ